MGQEIGHTHFSDADFTDFADCLRRETGLLEAWFRDGLFSARDRTGGFELEAWLIDAGARAAPVNAEFLARLDDPMVVPELARFNVELNDHPQHLWGSALSRFEASLGATWKRCGRVAEKMGVRLLMIGILPTLREEQLTQANMSDLRRYRALNEQVLRLREGRPLELDIQGHERLKAVHGDVMLESATTSFQLHLKVHPRHAVRAYNAAQVISAPMVAVTANSPFLFRHDLWDETRIPLFEQSVAVGGIAGASHGPLRRVTFGSGYARASLYECFLENQQHYPVLLPIRFDEGVDRMAHLRLHNGTIWRWNRPLIGFDYDGIPHLRIEHRVAPGGPTVADVIANAALFFGLMQVLMSSDTAIENRIAFSQARDNFYAAARHGLNAQVGWGDSQRGPLRALLLSELLPLARQGLAALEIDTADSEHYLGIIEARARGRATGADWQRAWVARHGPDMVALTEAYARRQQEGRPVHEWDVGDA